MTSIRRLAILCYVMTGMLACVLLISFVLNVIDFKFAQDVLGLIYRDESLRLGFGIFAGIILLLNLIMYYFLINQLPQDKIIAFDNPSGRVSVSLIALDEMIRRMLIRFPEIKDVKSRISGSKKGLKAKIKLILRSEGNIPEVTSKVQDMVKAKIQDTIGIDEPVNVSIYIGKILGDRIKGKQSLESLDSKQGSEPNIPFRGYKP